MSRSILNIARKIRKAAQAWSGASAIQFSLESINIHHLEFDTAWRFAAPDLKAGLKSDYRYFYDDITQAAMGISTSHEDINKPDEPITYMTKLFVLPVHGTINSIQEFASSARNKWMAHSFHRHNIVTPESIVNISPIPLTPDQLINTGPGLITRIARSRHLQLLRLAIGMRKKFALTPGTSFPLSQAAESAEGSEIVTRLFIGARMLPYRPGSDSRNPPPDFFTGFIPPDLLDQQVEQFEDFLANVEITAAPDGSLTVTPKDDADLTSENAVRNWNTASIGTDPESDEQDDHDQLPPTPGEQSMIDWVRTVNGKYRKIDIRIDRPCSWVEAIEIISRRRIFAAINDARAAAEINDDPIKEVHIAADDGQVLLTTVHTRAVLGPVQLEIPDPYTTSADFEQMLYMARPPFIVHESKIKLDELTRLTKNQKFH